MERDWTQNMKTVKELKEEGTFFILENLWNGKDLHESNISFYSPVLRSWKRCMPLFFDNVVYRLENTPPDLESETPALPLVEQLDAHESK